MYAEERGKKKSGGIWERKGWRCWRWCIGKEENGAGRSSCAGSGRVDVSGVAALDRGNRKEEADKEKKAGRRRARLEGAREKRRIGGRRGGEGERERESRTGEEERKVRRRRWKEAIILGTRVTSPGATGEQPDPPG